MRIQSELAIELEKFRLLYERGFNENEIIRQMWNVESETAGYNVACRRYQELKERSGVDAWGFRVYPAE